MTDNTITKTPTLFERLSAINVNDKVEKKTTGKTELTYLSWAWAWSAFKRECPDATYKILPTDYDEQTGFMCHTEVTAEGQTLEMWLPVMDGSNKSMKKYSYEYETRFGVKTVEAATTFDINKTLMRCLVKNLAMFGLGIYIFAGEDLPEGESEAKVQSKESKGELPALEIPSENWDRVSKYLSDNKKNGADKLIKQVSRKYTISAEVLAEINAVINE